LERKEVSGAVVVGLGAGLLGWIVAAAAADFFPAFALGVCELAFDGAVGFDHALAEVFAEFFAEALDVFVGACEDGVDFAGLVRGEIDLFAEIVGHFGGPFLIFAGRGWGDLTDDGETAADDLSGDERAGEGSEAEDGEGEDRCFPVLHGG
jgi:hypothetical protein